MRKKILSVETYKETPLATKLINRMIAKSLTFEKGEAQRQFSTLERIVNFHRVVGANYHFFHKPKRTPSS